MTVLESERMLFRPHEPDDLEAYCAMEMDAEVRRYVGGTPRTRETAEERFRRGLGRPVIDRLGMWATVLKAESSYIGRCGLYPHFKGETPVPGEAALGIYLARAYWGRGLATEATRAFVGFGFEQLGVARIVTAIQVENAASVRIFEKLGFLLVKTEVGARSFYHFELLNPASRLAAK